MGMQAIGGCGLSDSDFAGYIFFAVYRQVWTICGTGNVSENTVTAALVELQILVGVCSLCSLVISVTEL